MYLLDTHALLWFLLSDSRLPEDKKNLIEDTQKVYVSVGSLWEIAIKQSIGKLKIKHSIVEIAEKCIEKNIVILPIHPEELDKIKKLPDIHKDPFDRLFVSQAIRDNLIIITKDENIPKYPVESVW